MGSWVIVPAMFALHASHHVLMFLAGRAGDGAIESVQCGPPSDSDLDVTRQWPGLDIPSLGFPSRLIAQKKISVVQDSKA